MRLITLNIWGGMIYDPLINFLKERAKNVDIFCFQEVFNNPPGVPSRVQTKKIPILNIYSDLKELLPEFNDHIHPTQEGEESLAMFIKNTLPIDIVGEIFVYRWKNAMEGNDASTYGINIEYFQTHQGDKKYTVCNLHGHWTPQYKGDNPARIEQSKNIKKFLDEIDGKKILCGDFNVAPETKSMDILEGSMKNLIKENGVTSTRSHYYPGEIKFADYILVSPDIQVKEFKVLQDVVSDHLPLYLEFD